MKGLLTSYNLRGQVNYKNNTMRLTKIKNVWKMWTKNWFEETKLLNNDRTIEFYRRHWVH
jgi:hypothetical protein